MLGWYCFSMEKLETWIYIQRFWLQIFMVSPGTHLVKNIESQSRNIESQIKKDIQVCNWKCLGLCVSRQLIWLISLTDSKTLYYSAVQRANQSIAMPSQSKSTCFFSTSHFNIRSLSANHDGLTMLLSDLQHSFDVIGLSETKITSKRDITS